MPCVNIATRFLPRRRLLVSGAACATFVLGPFATAVAADGAGADNAKGAAKRPIYLDLPDIITNLQTKDREDRFVKMKITLQLETKLSGAAISDATPKLLDMFQTYLRGLEPEDLQGSEGMYRLHEDLLARANIVLAPAGVSDILIDQIIVQ